MTVDYGITHVRVSQDTYGKKDTLILSVYEAERKM